MKIIISVKEKNMNTELSELFGRAPYFCFLELEKGKIVSQEFKENPSKDIRGGAGSSAAKMIVEAGGETVITGNLGPRAEDALKQFGVKVYRGAGRIKTLISDFQQDKLERLI